jgi:hypothetical protein
MALVRHERQRLGARGTCGQRDDVAARRHHLAGERVTELDHPEQHLLLVGSRPRLHCPAPSAAEALPPTWGTMGPGRAGPAHAADQRLRWWSPAEHRAQGQQPNARVGSVVQPATCPGDAGASSAAAACPRRQVQEPSSEQRDDDCDGVRDAARARDAIVRMEPRRRTDAAANRCSARRGSPGRWSTVSHPAGRPRSCPPARPARKAPVALVCRPPWRGAPGASGAPRSGIVRLQRRTRWRR